MKGIKDYFSSPIKQVEVDSRNLIIPENINPTQCKQEFDTNQNQAKKKQKRKKKRKHSDPAITDVTELLSDNLKFSPNNSSQAKLISIKSNTKNIKSDSANNGKPNAFENTEENDSKIVAGCIIKESKLKVLNTCLQDNKKPLEVDSSSKTESDDKNYKLNAFQFMMDKRNKSIGSNSPGKELIKELSEDAEDKEKLVARRHLFLNWSELKGGKKRKRFEQDKDEIIKQKLNERTKRFKKLLKVESENNKRVKGSKRKRIKKISSSSDENDKLEEKEVNGKVSNDSRKRKSRTQKVDNYKKSIHHENLEGSSEEVVEQKGNENYMDKKGSAHINNNRCNDIGENITNLEKEYNQTKPKKGNLLSFIKLDKHDNTESINIDDSAENLKKTNRKEYNISKSTKQSKVGRQKSDTIIQKDEEASQESVFTPRTLRSWKMRIKMKADEGKSRLESNESTQKIPINYNLELSSSDDSNKIELSSGSEYDETSVKLPKKTLKIAPIFTKSTPKSKLDPAIIEARKQFLMSGIPSSLKRVIERQNSVVDQQDVFPVTSHVQQKCNSLFWNLPQTQLKLLDNLSTSLQIDLKCEKLTKSYVIKDINIDTEVKKVVNLKALLNKIKKENPDYPVNKSFRQIYSKKSSEIIEENKIAEKRKRGKKRKEKISVPKVETNVVDYSMWTEKYKPRSSHEIMGNSQAIKRLKKWLEDWKQFSQEIHSKRIKRNSSDSEFETTDCDSRDSSKLPGKIIILEGPCGTGKTTAVYAICNDLGFNVIELNASNKRTGKRLLQELQEATQSHQVRNRESQSFQTFFQLKSEISEPQPENKMCLLLIEDVDLVFEQDDGFINALLQLTATSKRPIIATTTDYASLFVQKFFGMYEFINFLPLSSFSLATWLQIVFLVEGSYVSRDEIGSLLEFYKGDVRKTLLQLQFWIQSGCQTQRKPSLIKIEYKRNSCDERLGEDELYNSVVDDESFECDSFEHKNFISTFEILEINEPFQIPYYLNLDLLWWNIPNILNIPNYTKQRIDNIPDKMDKEQEGTSNRNKMKEDLLLISKVHDSLSYVDVVLKNNVESSTGNCVNVKDSLELCENFNSYKDSEFLHELTHYLVNGCISNYGNKEGKLDVAMPDKMERRWKSRLQECESEFKEALLLSTDRKSTALDYMPVLRNITRSECARAANNTKRGNRFRNYLKDVGVKCQDKIIRNACRIFKNDNSV